MKEVFIVVWSGGYEAPTYIARPTKEEAIVIGRDWTKDMEDGDTVDILRINLTNMTLERVEL